MKRIARISGLGTPSDTSAGVVQSHTRSVPFLGRNFISGVTKNVYGVIKSGLHDVHTVILQ